MASTAAVAIFIVFAAVELVADQLPKAPSRTAPPGLIARIVLGALCGAALSSAGGAIPGDRRAFWARWAASPAHLAATRRAHAW